LNLKLQFEKNPQLVPLPLLADPQNYIACTWDLITKIDQRDYWLVSFARHFTRLLDEAVAVAVHDKEDPVDARGRADQCAAEFGEILDALAADPQQMGQLDILGICHLREQVLRRGQFDDPYRLAKQRENIAALTLLPALLEELDQLNDHDRIERLIQGVFAGNIYDLGATDVADEIAAHGVDFHGTRQKLSPRPWLFDHLDAWRDRLDKRPAYRAAVMFVDNAGCDVLLGMIPLARELLQRGTAVILTANTLPTLNDITHDELNKLIQQIADWDAPIADALSQGRLELVASGNGYPLIDLTGVSPELVEAIDRRQTDLIVLEGMGRAIESNLEAAFTCDALKLAMIKDKGVGTAIGGKMYDLVMRYDPV
jgi:uncharacterized protein with ATP-grasp and redox domains